MSIPQAGETAPDFDLATSGGDRVRLSELRGRRVVLWFYPKDDTPGCTIEAKGFTAAKPRFDEAGAVLLGINTDGVASHDEWVAKLGIPFQLVADPDRQAIDAYGVWGTVEWQGRTFETTQRTTFLIDEEGAIARVWETVKPTGHAEEVLEALGAGSAPHREIHHG